MTKLLTKPSFQPLTSLDRKIDLAYPSNRFVMAVAAIGALVAILFGSPWQLVISSAVWVFATWALGRELDPDHALTANLASGGIVLLLALHPASRVLAFEALCATGVLVLCARAALGTSGRALTWNDQLLVAIAPIVADALSGLPLRMLGISSFGALFGRQARVIIPTRTARLMQRLVWGLAAFSVAWLVVQTLLGSNFLLSSQIAWFSKESVIAAVILTLLGALGLARRLPSSKADNGNPLRLEHFYWQRVSVFVGAIVAALFTPWTLWVGLGLVGLFSLVLNRLPNDS